MSNTNHIKAYLLGLLVGGGKIDKDVFVIDLPFKKWGLEPHRMNIIATDILTKICQYFNSTYNFNVNYEITNNKWLIKPFPNANIEELKKDLESLQLPTSGFLLAKADLTYLKSELKGISIESFLSGIFDTRASLTKSHRRFNYDAPVVSIEIPGSTENFRFVVQLCSWLTDLGSTTDQILYNHPNQHSASDPSYKGWKKGFKIRFLVRSFLAKHSFALQSKSIDVTELERSQKKNEQTPCYLRKLRSPSPVTVHSDQNSNDLPQEVRNKMFFHYHHFCAVIGCPHAPIEEIKRLVTNKEAFINFYPILTKGNKELILNQIELIKNADFPEMKISVNKSKIKAILKDEQLKDFLGTEQGIAYLFAEKLMGKRHSGNMKDIIAKSLDCDVDIVSIEDNLEIPLVFVNNSNDRAFICSSIKSIHNQSLIRHNVEVNNLIVSIKE